MDKCKTEKITMQVFLIIFVQNFKIIYHEEQIYHFRIICSLIRLLIA